MNDPQSTFVYVSLVRTTAEQLWKALVTPEFMKQYFSGAYFKTDWKPGSPWELTFEDGRVADSGEVLECEKPKRIVLTWRHELNPEITAEGYGRCTIELEQIREAVKLTITHTADIPNSRLIKAVSGGWPSIVSNLKSLLETGTVALVPPQKTETAKAS